MQIQPEIHNEYGRLRSVVVGVARRMGGIPTLEECYDARSYETVQLGSYPNEEACKAQMKGLIEVLEGLGVEVMRPEVIAGVNQVFARDIGFVIEDQYIIPNIIEDRAEERDAMGSVEARIPSANIIMMPSGCHAEGGDVLVHNDYIFVGVSNDDDFNAYKTARTNYAGYEYLMDEFPAKEFKSFELLKNDQDPRSGSLHLDCAFQPVGGGALLAPHLFKNAADVKWIENHFGTSNIFYCDEDEAYDLTTNVFSVSADEIIVPMSAKRLTGWLEERGFTVHAIAYNEIVKMGGLLRCSTMPIQRSHD
jgi:N-dimethylarginine dimethylaminohydrolase